VSNINHAPSQYIFSNYSFHPWWVQIHYWYFFSVACNPLMCDFKPIQNICQYYWCECESARWLKTEILILSATRQCIPLICYCKTGGTKFWRSLPNDVQGEHKVFPWRQTFITRKLRGIQTYFFLPLLKLVYSQTSWVELHFEKKYVCIPRSFLLINVCYQGKTLCSPCTKVQDVLTHKMTMFIAVCILPCDLIVVKIAENGIFHLVYFCL